MMKAKGNSGVEFHDGNGFGFKLLCVDDMQLAALCRVVIHNAEDVTAIFSGTGGDKNGFATCTVTVQYLDAI